MGPKARARGGMIGAAGLAAVLAAISLSFSSTASAADIVNLGGAPPKVGKVAPAGVASPVFRQNASTDDFWTRERMLSARPLDNSRPVDPLALPDFSDRASASAATGDFTPADVTAFPNRVHGKIFFLLNGDTYTCSGTVVESAPKNVVFTAGHCVYDVDTKSYVSQLAFVPAYENGNVPYDVFYANGAFTTNQWKNSGNNSYDVAVVTLENPVQSQVGSRKLAFDLSPMVNKAKKREYTIYGYPSQPSSMFDGEILRGCRAAFDVFDSTPPNMLPYPLAGKPCLMQQGASGGGWVTLGNYLNSVVSYGYCDNIPEACGIIFGPYFSNAAKSLYVLAGGSPAPTVKLLSAPPKVVRKRKVRFRFSGNAATLLGFTCKLDRQKKVDCSSRISITNLRRGKHTLRVQAVDQTGRKSKKTIVRNFRVKLPRR